jgi:hypothetical protein
MHLNTSTCIKKLKIRKGVTIIKKIIENINYYKLIDIGFMPIPERVHQDEKALLEEINLAEKILEHKFNVDTIQALN